MGFEDRLARDLDRRRVWGYTDDEKFNKEIARAWKKSAFNPYDFAPKPYSRDEVSSDEARVSGIKKSPDYVHERGSETVALEYVLMEGIKVHGWFGDEVVSVRKTSEYDDVFGGADFVVTFESEDTGQLINLAVDATTAADRSVLIRKEEKTIKRLNQGKMAEIKYFEDPDGERGPAFMPRVVLGLSPEETLKLQKMLVERPDLASKAPSVPDFLKTAAEQLLHFINYVLRRRGMLGEGRELRTVVDAKKFMVGHKEDLSEDVEKIIENHLAVLEIIEVVFQEKKIARDLLAMAS